MPIETKTMPIETKTVLIETKTQRLKREARRRYRARRAARRAAKRAEEKKLQDEHPFMDYLSQQSILEKHLKMVSTNLEPIMSIIMQYTLIQDMSDHESDDYYDSYDDY